MTLEVLFAQASQGRTFLLMVLCGAAMALGQIILRSGEGLRLYGLLGLCIGASLYAAGVAPAVSWLHRRLTN